MEFNEPTTYTLLFLLPLLSGWIITYFKTPITVNLKMLLSFSGSFLLAICFLHLIPELYHEYSYSIGIFILIGFLLQILLEYFSKGIEHGHYHPSKEKSSFPYSLFLSLCIHSFVEGMVLVEPHAHHGHSFNNTSLLIGILIHKVPIAVILATLMVTNKTRLKYRIFSVFIFAITAPLGLFLATTYGSHLLDNVALINALAVGILLHVSTTILFETSEAHKFDLKKFMVIILGLISAIIVLL
ncbi:MAG: ZIP family metal transporter [Flavobacteriales bacterium]|nr:ZIP family metal transporter [Flavobacteriales bacterium]